MPNQSLVDLMERTATADTDLIHVNSGGSDYKQTKANFLANYVSEIEFNSTSALTTQVDALPVGYYGAAYTGKIASYGHQSETGVPENDNYTVEVSAFSSQNKRITIMSVLSDKTYTRTKLNGTWESWILVPRRDEITSLNNSLTQSSGSVSASVGSGSIDYFKFGSVVTIKIAINSLTISQDTSVATLPSAIRPRVDLDFVEPISNGRCFITSAGLLKPQFSLTNGILRGAFTYVI